MGLYPEGSWFDNVRALVLGATEDGQFDAVHLCALLRGGGWRCCCFFVRPLQTNQKLSVHARKKYSSLGQDFFLNSFFHMQTCFVFSFVVSFGRYFTLLKGKADLTQRDSSYTRRRGRRRSLEESRNTGCSYISTQAFHQIRREICTSSCCCIRFVWYDMMTPTLLLRARGRGRQAIYSFAAAAVRRFFCRGWDANTKSPVARIFRISAAPRLLPVALEPRDLAW